MVTEFIVGPPEEKPRSDLRATYTPTKTPLTVEVTSKVQALYGDKIQTEAEEVCSDLGVDMGKLVLEDFGALPFVIRARVEAVLKRADPALEAESLPPFRAYCQTPSERDRFRRTRLYLPGNQPKFMLNAGIHRPDGIILDLEDSVPAAEKKATRFLVRNALRSLNFYGAERMVRINQGALGLEDLEYIVPHNVHLILIPKVEEAGQVQEVDQRAGELARQAGRKEPVFLMPVIESSRGVLKALEIAEASPNVVALAIGLEDYTADLGVARTESGQESFWARSMIVNAARAAGIQAIDSVYSDVADEIGLRAAARAAKALGFDGQGCIHPRQIGPVHEEFAPSEGEIENAQRAVRAYEEAEEKGRGVVSLGSKMIDPPVVKRALKTVELALATGRLDEDWRSGGS